MFVSLGFFSGATYKFRIAAVYSNNDNAHGPNSDKFEIKLHPEPNPEPPTNKPTIVAVTPIDFENIHALNVKWQVSTQKIFLYTFTAIVKSFGGVFEDIKK